MMEMATIHQGPITYLKYRDELSGILTTLKETYLNEDGSLKIKSQTAHVLALRFGILAPDQQARVAADLLELIKARTGPEHSGMTTGILGSKDLPTVLSRGGQVDEAARLIQSRKFPSLGFEVTKDATTIWESRASTDDNGDALSLSNPAHGASSSWLLSTLAGIAPATPGFDNIILEPAIPTRNEEVEPIRWVRAHYDSVRGRIAVHWQKAEAGDLLYEVTIPAGSSAILKLPAAGNAAITESGGEIDNSVGVRKIDPDVNDGMAYFELQSGSYRFEVK
jgi:alpha-L-rhamnosidase